MKLIFASIRKIQLFAQHFSPYYEAKRHHSLYRNRFHQEVCTTVLINFTFSNFKSYRDAQQFSMQRPTNAQKHEDGDWALKEYSTVAGVYGGNASGKSAFIDAFQAVTDFVCNGLNPNLDLSRELQPFRLDPDSRNLCFVKSQ